MNTNTQIFFVLDLQESGGYSTKLEHNIIIIIFSGDEEKNEDEKARKPSRIME